MSKPNNGRITVKRLSNNVMQVVPVYHLER